MENKKLVLIGGGGHCKSVLDTVLQGDEYDDIVITDPIIKAGTEIYGCKVVGTDETLSSLRKQGYEYAFITVGSITDAGLRIKLAGIGAALGFKFPIIIDSTAVVSKHSKIGSGTFIGKNVSVNADVVIGEHCIINTGAIIEHECKVGDYTHVSVGAILCGHVEVGYESFIGAGATIIQECIIGNKVVVGANSTILSDAADDAKIVKLLTKRGGHRLKPIFTPMERVSNREVA